MSDDTIRKLTIQAEMARRGLLPHQTRPYDDAEFGWRVPRTDPETITGAWEFLAWLAHESADWREPLVRGSQP